MTAGTNDFLPFADGATNVTDQATWAASSIPSAGFAAYPALVRSADMNKAIRQPSIMVSAIAQAIANQGVNVLDNDTPSTLIAQITQWLINIENWEAVPDGTTSFDSKYEYRITHTTSNIVGGLASYINASDAPGTPYTTSTITEKLSRTDTSALVKVNYNLSVTIVFWDSGTSAWRVELVTYNGTSFTVSSPSVTSISVQRRYIG